MAIDLEQFKTMFPKWKDCDDALLQLWADMSECMVCVPEQCASVAAKIPFFMLAHLLTTNNVSCAEAVDPDADVVVNGCNCDDDYLEQIFGMGGKISSVTVDGISASFDNGAATSITTIIAGRSPFRAWLATTDYGRMIVALLSRAGRGPRIACTGGAPRAHFAEPVLLHGYITGHA